MSDDLKRWDPIFPWIEQELGGRIIRSERQGRESGGRFAWFVDLEIGGEQVKTYVRGERDASFSYTRVYSTAREARILQVLHDAGVLVPKVLAVHESPQAAVLEHVEGRDNFNEVTDPGERDGIAEHFLELLADLHAVDVKKFESAGLRIPETPEEIALNDLDVWQSTYEDVIREPVPLITFACRWLRRNVPRKVVEPVLVQGDTGPGNLLFHEGRVSALVDFESLFFYNVKTQALVPMSLAPVMENLNARTEHAEWIAQYVFYLRTTSQALAEAIGLTLDEVELPAPRPTRFSRYYDLLIENLEEEQRPAIQDPFLNNRMWFASRLARHLRHGDTLGPAFEEQELDDLGALLGRRPESVQAGQRQLDALVREAGPERDAEFITYFYRFARREEALMEGALGLCEGAELSPMR